MFPRGLFLLAILYIDLCTVHAWSNFADVLQLACLASGVARI